MIAYIVFACGLIACSDLSSALDSERSPTLSSDLKFLSSRKTPEDYEEREEREDIYNDVLSTPLTSDKRHETVKLKQRPVDSSRIVDGEAGGLGLRGIGLGGGGLGGGGLGGGGLGGGELETVGQHNQGGGYKGATQVPGSPSRRKSLTISMVKDDPFNSLPESLPESLLKSQALDHSDDTDFDLAEGNAEEEIELEEEPSEHIASQSRRTKKRRAIAKKRRATKNSEGLFSNLRTPTGEISAQSLMIGTVDHHPQPEEQDRSTELKTEKQQTSRRRASRSREKRTRGSHINRYLTQGRPSRFWPKQGYFKNTYLGGNLSYHEELRQTSTVFKRLMSKQHGLEWSPPLDPPNDVGMTLSAQLSHSYIDQPRRVILQLGLKGSERYGWRRPALNMMITVDPALLGHSSQREERQSSLVELVLPILKRLNSADQVGLTLGRASISPRSPELLKEALIDPLSSVRDSSLNPGDWSRLILDGGDLLNEASSDPHRAPGAQAVLMICGRGCAHYLEEIKSVVHQLNLDGTLTSVIDHQVQPHSSLRSASSLWQIAEIGHGGFWLSHDLQGLKDAVNKEFDRFSRVVARLLRLSVKLQEGVELIEVLGSEMLTKRQKSRVKAREEAMDKRLSARLGIQSDRGKDDEGVQVVIPAFYGGDSHLIHLSLWVTKPGQIAEITLKYKDMVRAQNAAHSRSVTLGALPQPLTLAHRETREGADQHLIADHILRAIESGRAIQRLPAMRSLTQKMKLSRSLSSQEALLLSRARLGRPQSSLRTPMSSPSR